MNNELIKVKEEILKHLALGSEDECELERQASEKLERVLSTCLPVYDVDAFKSITEQIQAYMNVNDVRRRKLLNYSLEFVDPTSRQRVETEDGETVQLHVFLDEDELTKLYKFVKRHSADSSFDKTVYSVMDKHGMEPPDVYKNAMISRQDFSRVTEVGNTSVTRRMAWQIVIGLHCDMVEADEVLFSAGYVRRNTKFDLIMEYFIKHKNYDVIAINEVLYELGLKLFSCHKPVNGK